MRSKYLSIVLIAIVTVLVSANAAIAQIKSVAWSSFIPVRTYNGVTQQNTFSFQIDVENAVNVPNWSLMIRVNGPIRNSEQKTLDPSKLKIRINHITGLTLEDIGANNTPVPLSQAGIAIISNSKTPLFSTQGVYKKILISFDIIVEGGIYLQELKSWQNYFLNTVFSVVNQQGRVVTESQTGVQMQIHPDDQPPTGPTYSIQINATANDALLDFNSVAHYAEGVSKTYDDGLSITSSTNYAVQVRTLTPTFQATSSTVPVGTVRLNLKQANGNKEQTITLSPEPQTVISGLAPTGSQAQLFNIRYFTQPNDARLLNAKPDTYKATIMYTLIPQ